MKKCIIVVALALIAFVPADSFPRGPGGRGGGRPEGGSRPTPSFSGAEPHRGGEAPATPGGHPGFVPSNQPHPTPNRPNDNRPANNGVRPNDPAGNRNDFNNNGGNRNNFDNNNIGNRTNTNVNAQFNRNNVNNNVGNRTNTNVNNVNVNRTNNPFNTSVNNPNININRPATNTAYGYNRYQSNWAGWHNGYWNNWRYRPVAWLGAGATAGWMMAGGNTTYVYSNPFYVAVPNVSVPTLDYSQPIPVPVASSDDGSSPAPAAVPPNATQDMDAARAAFKKGDYARAQSVVEKAITELPDDATLHEFRGLTLFAQKQYKDAAAAIYAVLSVGPGWNWETMRSCYPDVDTYTKQLRALEAYVGANPKSSDGHFLLAYHYLVLNQAPAAVKELQGVVQLLPNDKLCPQLIKAFAPPDGDRPVPAAP